MAPMRGPTTAAIPGHIKVPSTKPALVKILARLSRTSLIDLALRWLDSETNPALHPYLESNRNLSEEAEEDYLYTPAKDIEELRTTYQNLKHEKGTKREIIDRILDGDWRRGISLQQLATIDLQHLQDNDTALQWMAWMVVPLHDSDSSKDISDDSSAQPRKRRKLSEDAAHYPQIQPVTFISTLQSEISSLVKAHYHLQDIAQTTASTATSLPVLRLFLSDSPYNTQPTCSSTSKSSSDMFLESTRTLYIALPTSCPYVYVALRGPAASVTKSSSVTTTTKMDIAAIKRTVLYALPKALSRPQSRWSLAPTDLTAKSLRSICALRGNQRGGASGGAFSIFSEGVVDGSPLDPRFDGCPEKKESEKQRVKRKRNVLVERDGNVENAKAVVEKVARRFGVVGIAQEEDENVEKGEKVRTHMETQAKTLLPTIGSTVPALDRVVVRIETDSDSDRPEQHQQEEEKEGMQFNIVFGGSDVFAGLRQLAELGAVDVAEKMPAWMTGEEGASIFTVRDGLVVGGRAGGAC